jgi:hypothetical protein
MRSMSDDPLKALQADIDARRLRFAPLPRDAYLVPEFVHEFSRRILGCEWETVGATDLSSALDFADMTREQLVARVRMNYGVDVDDIPGLNLWEVIRRCAGE